MNKIPEETTEKKSFFNIPRIIAFSTFLVSLITLASSILSLNKPFSEVFYSKKYSKFIIPKEFLTDKLEALIAENQIPLSILEICVINQGNAPSGITKISMKFPDKPTWVSTNPDKSEKPVWVEIGDIEHLKDFTKVNTNLKNFAITRPFKIQASFNKYFDEKDLDIEIFYDGKPAKFTDDIMSVPKWSKFRLFLLPIYIFCVGISLFLISSFISALITYEEFRESFFEISEILLKMPFITFSIRSKEKK